MIAALLLTLPLTAAQPPMAALAVLAPIAALAQNPAEASPSEAKPAASEERQLLAETTIGMRARLPQMSLPGTLLQAKDVLDPGKADAVLRVISAEAHGGGYHYEFELTPYVTGKHDLREYLERADSSTMEGLPAIPIQVTAVLPPGRMLPGDLPEQHKDRFGGYTNQITFAIIAWVLGLFLIFYLGGKKRRAERASETSGPKTLAQRLRPMVEAAQSGELSDADRASLERTLLAYWRKRRNLESTKMSEAMVLLREDSEAGPLLVQLERWLHRPANRGDAVDVNALLEPYRDAPDLETPSLALEGA